ncbi:MAG: asparagine synthase (glutamine-hydrolyzing) [Acidobacteria bacterium]|nr:asparagine synthase (glutamine-hydrolyzing) [Acidobacteriota bacterium]
MSGIAGIYNRDGRPVDAALLRRMTAVISHRGPDGVEHWVHGAVGLGHRMLHTTPESLLEQQPLSDETGALCLTLDGRVDNREELRKGLEAKGLWLRSDTDAELVLRAYQCWGEECPAQILGDFAFAIWDGHKRQLFCARDIMGIKPFYYYCDGRTFLFASELHQLLECPAVPGEPNEGFIAECLSGADPSLDQTLFANIFQLPRAHAMVVRADEVRKTRYWDVVGLAEIRYPNDQDYADHFLEIFWEAVRCRLRSQRRVDVLLSGGLDSSSVVCVAQWLSARGAAEHAGLESVSLAFPGRECDETHYIEQVVRKCGLESCTVAERRPGASAYRERIRLYRDLPDSAVDEAFSPALERVRETDGRVVLTGYGGDEWLTGSLYHTADLLRHFYVGKAIRQSYLDSRNLSNGHRASPSFLFLRYGFWPLLPQRARRGIRQVVKGERDGGVPAWIRPEFAQHSRLAERLRRADRNGEHFASIAHREDLGPRLDFPWYSLVDRYVSRFGLEYRHPLLDRRVMEYCLALPQEQLRYGKEAKLVLRNAMKGLLPEAVRTRHTKAHYGTHTYAEALEDLGGDDLFGSLEIAARGWVDGARVREMYQQAAARFRRSDPAYRINLYPLWMIASIELWHRIVFSSPGDTLPKDTNLYANLHA